MKVDFRKNQYNKNSKFIIKPNVINSRAQKPYKKINKNNNNSKIVVVRKKRERNQNAYKKTIII